MQVLIYLLLTIILNRLILVFIKKRNKVSVLYASFLICLLFLEIGLPLLLIEEGIFNNLVLNTTLAGLAFFTYPFYFSRIFISNIIKPNSFF